MQQSISEKQQTRIEINSITGRKSVLMRTKCRVCMACWIDIHTGICTSGGPFSGYAYFDDQTAKWIPS